MNETASETPDKTAPPSGDLSTTSDEKILNRIIKRLGGRHLIFQTHVGKWGILPKPYVLVSTFRGPMWFFYGAGQVWLTHKKYHEYDGWMARVPRVWAPKLSDLLDKLEPQLTEFTHHCNEHGIEGTILIDLATIEFHWTFAFPLKDEKLKQENANMLDDQFRGLVDAFLAVQSSATAEESSVDG